MPFYEVNMLHTYSFSNFQSFAQQTTVDFRVTKKVRDSDWISERPTGERVSKVMAVLGANAAGKTALLKPAAFLGWFIAESFQNPAGNDIPIVPHFAYADQPSEFSCILDFDGRLWRYELVCTRKRVLREALYHRPASKFRYVFVREYDEQAEGYVVRQQDFGLPDEAIVNLRPDVSLISWGAQYGVPMAQTMARPMVFSNVSYMGRLPTGDDLISSVARYYRDNPQQRAQMVRLLSSWDLGLSDVQIRDIPITDRDNPDRTDVLSIPYGQHLSIAGSHELPFHMESSGTKGAFIHLMRILSVLERGGIAVVDELEGDLHPHMLEPILDLFANAEMNPYDAQLLFSCHAPEVLNSLDKAQVILVEKDDQCESAAIRLDKVEGIRADENHYAKYMAGAYGAIPQV
jgi:hypothetical protein